MGSDINVKLGPYIKVSGKLEKSVIKVKRVCLNHPNITHKNAKFCPLCGAEIHSLEYNDLEPINLFQLLDENGFYDTLYTVGYLDGVLLPNDEEPNAIEVDIEDANEKQLVDIDEIRMQHINWMHSNYINEIKLLKETFGDENVLVTWGLITYWS